MRPPNVHPDDDLDCLIATPKGCSATEAARVQPDRTGPPAHDAFTRLPTRLEPDPDTLWAGARTQVGRAGGVLVVDDPALDDPYATAVEPVTRHWSGRHRAVVRGINLVSLLWTDGDRHLRCDYRLCEGSGGATKNDHFGGLIRAAHTRGFRPRCVVLDGWYGSLENLNLVRACGRAWLARLKANRKVRVDHGEARAVGARPVAASGTVVRLPGFGEVRASRAVAPDGDTAHWAAHDPGMTDLTRVRLAEFSWAVEHHRRGVEQCTGIERRQCHSARAPRNHIGLALRAFLRLEIHCFARGISWAGAETAIIRDAVRAYLARPRFRLPMPAIA